jgi:L-alanine-DL-glutamate epimerase-like enolase superfamily enzyme
MTDTSQRRSLSARAERIPLKAPFHISGHTFEDVDLAVVELRQGPHRGRGEASGVYYFKEDASVMVPAIEAVRGEIEGGIGREALRELMPPGGARNAVDCALWELEAQQAGWPAWMLAGVGEPGPRITTFTLSADAPERMANGARGYGQARALKLKLTGEDPALDAERVRMVRAVRPDVWLGVDGNQGFTPERLERLMPALLEARVELVEQPFPRGCEAWMAGLKCPIATAADESVQGLEELEGLTDFDVVNIKLDKCGGLTEGLAMARLARRMGLGVMVGNMVGTSWAMAPAFVLGLLCDIVDLDGPIVLRSDRTPHVTYRAGKISCPDAVWGAPATPRPQRPRPFATQWATFRPDQKI